MSYPCLYSAPDDGSETKAGLRIHTKRPKWEYNGHFIVVESPISFRCRPSLLLFPFFWFVLLLEADPTPQSTHINLLSHFQTKTCSQLKRNTTRKQESSEYRNLVEGNRDKSTMKGEPEEKEKRRKNRRAESETAGQSWSNFSSRSAVTKFAEAHGKQVTEMEVVDLD